MEFGTCPVDLHPAGGEAIAMVELEHGQLLYTMDAPSHLLQLERNRGVGGAQAGILSGELFHRERGGRGEASRWGDRHPCQ
eukprot:3441200-Pyramimonas_sp.AAC.1